MFLSVVGNALFDVDFVLKEIDRCHRFIDDHKIPVEKIDDDLHQQLLVLEKWNGTDTFTKALSAYKRWNKVTMGGSIIHRAIIR